MRGHGEDAVCKPTAEAQKKPLLPPGLRAIVPGFKLPVVLCYCSRRPLMLTLRTCTSVSTWAKPHMQAAPCS